MVLRPPGEPGAWRGERIQTASRRTGISARRRSGLRVRCRADAGTHLYQVTETAVVHQDDLHLYGSDEATITLVSCVPRLVYDHRLLVTAKLVGVGN